MWFKLIQGLVELVLIFMRAQEESKSELAGAREAMETARDRLKEAMAARDGVVLDADADGVPDRDKYQRD